MSSWYVKICTFIDLYQPYYRYSDLEKYIIARGDKIIPEYAIWNVFRQIISALNYLHHQQNAIVHRDISPDNILIAALDANQEIEQTVLTDYDTVREIHKTMVQTKTGKIGYWAPEVERGDKCGARADIWSFGVVLYRMMTLSDPRNVVYQIRSDDSERTTHTSMKQTMMV